MHADSKHDLVHHGKGNLRHVLRHVPAQSMSCIKVVQAHHAASAMGASNYLLRCTVNFVNTAPSTPRRRAVCFGSHARKEARRCRTLRAHTRFGPTCKLSSCVFHWAEACSVATLLPSGTLTGAWPMCIHTHGHKCHMIACSCVVRSSSCAAGVWALGASSGIMLGSPQHRPALAMSARGIVSAARSVLHKRIRLWTLERSGAPESAFGNTSGSMTT